MHLVNRRTLLLLLPLLTIGSLVWVTNREVPEPPAPAPPQVTTPDTSSPAVTNSSPDTEPPPGVEVEANADPPEVPTSPGPLPYAQTEQARQQWRPVILGFSRAYPTPADTRAAWVATLSPYSTPAVDRALANRGIDDALTGTRFDSYDVLEYRADEVVARVTYRNKAELVLYVRTADQHNWTIRAYDKRDE